MKQARLLACMFILFLALSPAYAGETGDAEQLLGAWTNWHARLKDVMKGSSPYTQQERDEIWRQLLQDEKVIFSDMAKEFSALGNGVMTHFTQRVLKDAAMLRKARFFLAETIAGLPPEQQRVAAGLIFKTIPEPEKGQLLSEFLFARNMDEGVFHDENIQQWLAWAIEKNLKPGPLYFILSEENAQRVMDFARTDMRLYSKETEIRSHLYSAAFLASRGDRAGVRFLLTLLKHRSETLQTDKFYLFPILALAGNRRLTEEMITVLKTDKRKRLSGYDCVPQEWSFAHEAAAACSDVIAGFPAVPTWENFTDEKKQTVLKWLEQNPDWKLKRPDYANLFSSNRRLSLLLITHGEELQRLRNLALTEVMKTEIQGEN